MGRAKGNRNISRPLLAIPAHVDVLRVVEPAAVSTGKAIAPVEVQHARASTQAMRMFVLTRSQVRSSKFGLMAAASGASPGQHNSYAGGPGISLRFARAAKNFASVAASPATGSFNAHQLAVVMLFRPSVRFMYRVCTQYTQPRPPGYRDSHGVFFGVKCGDSIRQ